MKNKILSKIIMMIFIIVIISSTQVFAQVSPTDITGETSAISDSDLDISFMDDITDFIQKIGTFLAVGALMIIGIRYVFGSVEDKANYKKTLVPYAIGCFILFGASNLAPQIQELFEDVGSDVDAVGNTIIRYYSNNRNICNCWSNDGIRNQIYDWKYRRKSKL